MKAWIIAWWRRLMGSAAAPTPPPSPPPPPLDDPKHAAAIAGQFYFREAILDRLAEYLNYIARMKKVDAAAYATYKRIGMAISTEQNQDGDDMDIISIRQLEPWFVATRPTFGAVVWPFHGYKLAGDKICARFVYFQKYARNKQPCHIQLTNRGDVYVVTMYYDEGNNKWSAKRGVVMDYAVAVSPIGEMTPLKMVKHTQLVKPRHGGSFVIPSRRWQFPGYGIVHAADNGRSDVEMFLREIFCAAANIFTLQGGASSMIRVSAQKDGVVAVFSVPERRTSYFFKDREVVLNKDGKTRRIFHIVRAHQRVNGQSVRLHFRGLREFIWNDYKIMITVPGKHHVSISEVDVAAVDREKSDPGVSYVEQDDVADALMKHVHGEDLAVAFNAIPRAPT